MTISVDESTGTREQILVAAYHALEKHGYADLTIGRIGEEFDKSTSLIYHHFDGKDDLLLACLEFMLDLFAGNTAESDHTDPKSDLESFIEGVFSIENDAQRYQLMGSLIELRLQSTHNDGYRAHFDRSDLVIQNALAETVTAGIENGVFQQCDPDAVAATIHTLLIGSSVRLVTTGGDGWKTSVREEIFAYLSDRVYA